MLKNLLPSGNTPKAFSFTEENFQNPLDKRTYVLYDDICDFVALCGKTRKLNIGVNIFAGLTPDNAAAS